ncbi:Short-chain dehydrogenase/reductas [Mycobacteroides abscessus subsp. abscessus]|nr:Short-chain dehydrogenase/reductas [Mycobacteroides abscessus subsp. abscessus]
MNTIAPGLIDTPIYGEGESAQQFKDRLAPNVLYPQRLGNPEEFASLALELRRTRWTSSPRSSAST